MADVALDRYSRQMRFYGVGEAGQKKLQDAELAQRKDFENYLASLDVE